MRKMVETGTRFGRFTVIGPAPSKVYRGYTLLCCFVLCDCGEERSVRVTDLRSGHSRSCGCFKRDRFQEVVRRHGHGSNKQGLSPAYRSWQGIKQRCLNPKNPRWSTYGGRGIKVCDRWLTFENFLADMGERPKGLTIDRIDGNGNYEPGNCRWATWRQQRNNQSDVIVLSHEGEALPLTIWADRVGLNPKTIRARLDAGWPIDQSLTTPRQISKKPFCKYGHAYTPETTFICPNGARKCRICIRASHAAFRARKKK